MSNYFLYIQALQKIDPTIIDSTLTSFMAGTAAMLSCTQSQYIITMDNASVLQTGTMMEATEGVHSTRVLLCLMIAATSTQKLVRLLQVLKVLVGSASHIM